MNILHISTSKTWRGGEQQLAYLCDVLATEYNANQTVLCIEDSPLVNRISVEIVVLKKPSSISVSWIKMIRKICKERQVDIIHVHDSKAQTLAVLSSFFYKILPIVVSRKVLFPVKGFLSKLKYQNRYIKKVICISSAVEEEMRKLIPNEKLIKISDCIDKTKFEIKTKRDFIFFNNSDIKIGYVAALTKEKDHITFINTAQNLLKKRNDISFYIVGSGSLEQKLKQKVVELNLEKNIIFTGFVKEINHLIVQLDMLLFTSEKEGLGTTVLDFFASKKPVVAVDSGGIKDVLISNKTGMLCKPKDVECLSASVQMILEDDTLKNTFVNNAYDLVTQHHSLSVLGEKHYNLYNEIIKVNDN